MYFFYALHFWQKQTLLIKLKSLVLRREHDEHGYFKLVMKTKQYSQVLNTVPLFGSIAHVGKNLDVVAQIFDLILKHFFRFHILHKHLANVKPKLDLPVVTYLSSLLKAGYEEDQGGKLELIDTGVSSLLILHWLWIRL